MGLVHAYLRQQNGEEYGAGACIQSEMQVLMSLPGCVDQVRPHGQCGAWVHPGSQAHTHTHTSPYACERMRMQMYTPLQQEHRSARLLCVFAKVFVTRSTTCRCGTATTRGVGSPSSFLWSTALSCRGPRSASPVRLWLPSWPACCGCPHAHPLTQSMPPHWPAQAPQPCGSCSTSGHACNSTYGRITALHRAGGLLLCAVGGRHHGTAPRCSA